MVSVTLSVTIFFFAIWMPGPEHVVPSSVTLHENNGQFTLDFARIDFVYPKSSYDWFFVGVEVNGVDDYLRTHYGVTVDFSQPQLTQSVNFTTTSGEKREGQIGGVHDQPWYGSKVMTTWLPYGYDMIDGMDAVTVDLDVVPVSEVAGMNKRRTVPLDANQFMEQYVKAGIRSEYLNGADMDMKRSAPLTGRSSIRKYIEDAVRAEFIREYNQE